MSPIFFRVHSERLSYFAVHWNQGNRITIPYAAVGYMTTTPKGNILIQAGAIRVTVQLGPRYKRRRKELDVIADALTDGRSYTTSAPGVPSNELASEQVKDSVPDAPAPLPPRGEAGTVDQNAPRKDWPIVDDFQTAFQQCLIQSLFHLPEEDVAVEVQLRTKDGYIPFPVYGAD